MKNSRQSSTLKRLSFGELKLSKLIGAFGFSQVVQLAASILRIPAIAENSSLNVLGMIFLWINVQSWGAVLSAGSINVSRISKQRGDAMPPISLKSLVARWIIFVLGLSLCFLPALVHTPIWFGGVGPTILVLLSATVFANNMGTLQGEGRVASIFVSTAAAAIASLAITFALTKSDLWEDMNSSLQVMTMSAVSLLSISIPMLLAWYLTRKSERRPLSAKPAKSSLKKRTFELAAVLPPAFISGFDTVALALSGKSSQIPEYGLVSRVGLITTVVVSALYVQLNNVAGKRSHPKIKDFLYDSLRLFILSLPFSVLFLLLSPTIVDKLSLGSVTAQSSTIASLFVVSLVLPIWQSCSANLMADDIRRQVLGRTVLLMILPSSIFFTFLGAYYLGAPGPFWASSLSYLAASLSAVIIFLRTSEKKGIRKGAK